MPAACKACGVILERQDRYHRDDCMPEEVRASAMAFREAGRVKLEVLRAAGADPARSDEANRRRGAKVAQRQREVRAWNTGHGVGSDPEEFRREILAGRQTVSL